MLKKCLRTQIWKAILTKVTNSDQEKHVMDFKNADVSLQ